MKLMGYIVVFFVILLAIIALFAVYAVWRLNKYIQNVIEDRLDAIEEEQVNLKNSIKIATKEGLIDEQGRIKQPYILKDEV